jgi:CotH kinase protein
MPGAKSASGMAATCCAQTGFAYLTVQAPGKFENQPLGLYVLIENPDAEFALDRLGSKKTPIFKPVTTDLFKDLGNDWKSYEGIYDLKTHASPAQRQRLIEFARLVTNADDAEFARRLPEFLDLKSFAGFVAGHVLLSSYDGFLTNGQNYYLCLDPRSNRFLASPERQPALVQRHPIRRGVAATPLSRSKFADPSPGLSEQPMIWPSNLPGWKVANCSGTARGPRAQAPRRFLLRLLQSCESPANLPRRSICGS